MQRGITRATALPARNSGRMHREATCSRGLARRKKKTPRDKSHDLPRGAVFPVLSFLS
jgi:hypothetical protein